MDKIIRLKVTEAEHYALRLLAATAGQSMQTFLRDALATSELAAGVFPYPHVNGGDKG